jgi:hypothetical protein
VLAPTPAASPPAAGLPASPQPVPPTFDVTFDKPANGAVRVSAAPVDDVAPAPPAPIAEPASELPLPTDSQASFLASGLEAPLPLSAPPPANAVGSPPVAFQNVPRRLLPAVSAHRSAADTAAIAVMLGLVLLWLAREGGPRTSGGRRPRLTLYDAPRPAEAVAVTRSGSPPPIR